MENKHCDSAISTQSAGSKFALNKGLKYIIVATFAVCSIGFLFTIIYFLYSTVAYRKQLATLAFGAYDQYPQMALDILSQTTSISAELLTIIISIFAIVVAVWVGLNIYNVLSKDEINTLKDNVSEAYKTVDYLSESYIQKSFIDFQNTFQSTYSEYTASNYVAFHFKDLITSRNYQLIDTLDRLEKIYHCTMTTYYNGSHVEVVPLANQALSICEELTGDVEYAKNNHLMGYLHIRISNLHYFIADGTSIASVKACISHGKLTLKYWFPILSTQSTCILCDSARYKDLNPQEIFSLMDIYNLIALSTSFLITNCKQTEPTLKEEMQTYYGELETLLMKHDFRSLYPERFALYMRNIGTSKDFAYYTTLETPISEDAIICYKKSIAANPKKEQAYRNIVSFRLKQFKYGYFSQKPESEQLQILEETIQYGGIYKALKPTSSEPYNFLASAYAFKWNLTKEHADHASFYDQYAMAILCLPYSEKETLLCELGKTNGVLQVEDILSIETFRFNGIINDLRETLIDAISEKYTKEREQQELPV